MSAIIIDNWTIERAAVAINDTYEGIADPNQEYASLIEAIILWDHVCFFDNSYAYQWKRILDRFEFPKYLKAVEEPDVDIDCILEQCAIQKDVITQGAIEYAEKATKLGIPFLVSEERNAFLNTYSKYQKNKLTNTPMEILDKKLNDYYKIASRCEVIPEFPALFDYVRLNTKDERHYINTALQIRNSGEAKKFREYINELDEAFRSGNFAKTNKLLDKYEKVIDKTIKGLKKDVGECSATMNISPFISFDVSAPIKKGEIVFAPNLKFIKKVTKTSIERRLW